MTILGLARPILSPMAAIIALLLTFFDIIAHQLPIPAAVVDEPIAYYVLKFVAFYVASLAVIKLGFLDKPFGPFLVGLIGATLVGVAYTFVEFVPLAQRPIGARFLWGVIHFILGVVAASIVLRRFGKALFALIFISVVILVIVGVVV